MFYILYFSVHSSVCYVYSTHLGVFRQFCYTQKLLSNCFVQSCAPSWGANKIWKLKQLVCCNNIVILLKLSACVGSNCNNWITMHGIENVKKNSSHPPTLTPTVAFWWEWRDRSDPRNGTLAFIYIYIRNFWVAYVSLVESVEINVP